MFTRPIIVTSVETLARIRINPSRIETYQLINLPQLFTLHKSLSDKVITRITLINNTNIYCRETPENIDSQLLKT